MSDHIIPLDQLPEAAPEAAPPTPSVGGGGIISLDQLPGGAGPTQPHADPDSDLTNNEWKQGLYNIRRADGSTIQVPFGKVDEAINRGHHFATAEEQQRYISDWHATPAGSPRWDLPHPLQRLSREMSGDYMNFLDLLSGVNTKAALTGGGPGEAIKDPTAGWGTKGLAMVMESLMGEAEIQKLPTVSARLARVGEIIKGLEQYPPKIRQALLVAMRSGSEVAAQDIATEKGVKTAATEGAMAAVTAPPLAAAAPYVAAPVKAALRYAQQRAPQTVEWGRVPIQLLAKQLNPAKEPLGIDAAEAPVIERGQQAGAGAVIKNTARDAAQNILERVNQTRHEFAPLEDPARLLEAPEGAQPFTFDLGPTGGPISETPGMPGTETPMVQRAATGEGGGFTSAAATGEDLAAQERAQSAIDQETLERIGIKKATGKRLTPEEREQYDRAWARESTPSAATPPEPATAATAAGGGTRVVTNPAEARQAMRGIEDFQATDRHAQLPQAQQDAIEAQRQSIEDQLGMYYSSPYHSTFSPVDVQASLDNVYHFGHAEDEVKATAGHVFQRLDELSDGRFTALNNQAKAAQKTMMNPSNEAAFDAARARWNDANGKIMDLINANRNELSRADVIAANTAWRQGSKLGELHALMESMHNGITWQESLTNLPRVMTGNAKRLEGWLSEDANREEMERVIGTEGVKNLKRISLMLGDASDARATQKMLQYTSRYMSFRIGHAGAGALAGTIAAHFLGAPLWAGGIAGATAQDAARMVLTFAEHSPTVGKALDYAVRQKMDPATAAPYLARMISQQFSLPTAAAQSKPDQKGKQQ